MFESRFLTGAPESHDALVETVNRVLELLREMPEQAYSGRSPADLKVLLSCDLGAEEGLPPDQILNRLANVVAHSINPNHPHAIAHLHCSTLIPAIATELLTGALNPSLDSFDQAPAATVIELQVLRHLCTMVGFPETSAGTFTPGATQSNLFGLLLAREAIGHSRFGTSVWRHGLGEVGGSVRILCSADAHFSVEKSAAQLGLGTVAVVRVPGDEAFRMSVPALENSIREIEAEGARIAAIVATAGTTDFGSIDPLAEIAELSHRAGAWFHVDAAYGGALLFSARHRSMLAGIELADSVSIDFHKLLWQPIGCGAFLVRDDANFAHVRMHADYLNPEEHEDDGIPDLVTRSLLTSRRFDALKLWVSLQLIGRVEVEAMINRTLALATGIAGYIRSQACLMLLHQPVLGCVVFRYLPERPECDANKINLAIRRDLFDSGDAVLGQTRVGGVVCMKLTCLNPCTTLDGLRPVVDLVVSRGRLLEHASTTSAEPKVEG